MQVATSSSSGVYGVFLDALRSTEYNIYHNVVSHEVSFMLCVVSSGCPETFGNCLKNNFLSMITLGNSIYISDNAIFRMGKRIDCGCNLRFFSINMDDPQSLIERVYRCTFHALIFVLLPPVDGIIKVIYNEFACIIYFFLMVGAFLKTLYELCCTNRSHISNLFLILKFHTMAILESLLELLKGYVISIPIVGMFIYNLLANLSMVEETLSWVQGKYDYFDKISYAYLNRRLVHYGRSSCVRGNDLIF